MSFQRLRPGSLTVIRTGILLSLLLLLAACGGNSQVQQSTPSSTKTVPFDLSIPQNALNSPTAGDLPTSTALHVVVTFKPNDQLLNQLGSTPVSKTTSGTDTATLANQLGITNQQYQQMKAFFSSQNFSLSLNKLHTALTIDATAGAFATLLHTKFVYHEYQNRKFFAPSGPLLLPETIAQHIEAISGLDSYSRPLKSGATATRVQPLTSHTGQNDCFPDPDLLTNTQVASAYGFNQLSRLGWEGQGTTIILPEFATFSQSDLQVYLSCVRFQGKVKYVNVDNNPPTDTDLEPLLDIEMIAGLLPKATIVVYQTANSWAGFDDVFSQAASDYSNNHSPVELSLSWGAAEDWMDPNDIKAVDAAFKTLVLAEHVNIFSSSGDCGAYDGIEYPTLDVDFPASDPYAIGVGGTQLDLHSNQRSQETVWQGVLNQPSENGALAAASAAYSNVLPGSRRLAHRIHTQMVIARYQMSQGLPLICPAMLIATGPIALVPARPRPSGPAVTRKWMRDSLRLNNAWSMVQARSTC